MSKTFENQLSAIANKQIKKAGVGKTALIVLKKQAEQLQTSYTAAANKVGECYSIANAVDYREDLFSQVKQINELAQSILPELSNFNSGLENFIALYGGRKRIFFEPLNAYKEFNESFNLDFKVEFKGIADLNLSFNPLCHPLKDGEPIVSKFYLAIQRYNKVCSLELVEIAVQAKKNGPIALDIKDFSKPVQLSLKVAQLSTIDGKALQKMYNYQAYLFAELNLDYKKEINNYRDFLSLPSFPIHISNALKAFSPKQIIFQFKSYESQFMQLVQLFSKFENLLMKKKALNPLISEELINTSAETTKELQNVQVKNIRYLKSLARLVKG